MYTPILLSSTEWLWLKVGEFPYVGLNNFKPMGKLSRIIWYIQKVIYLPILIWSKPTECQNYCLSKSGKKFHGSINNGMSYIYLKDPLKVDKTVNMLLSELHLGAGFKISSPEVIEFDVETGLNKVRFIQGFKRLVSCDHIVLFPILKELYSQGKLINYRDRIENSKVSDIVVREGVCHGDFAAFNMIFTKYNIILIDWNDSFFKGPILYDIMYYLVSSVVLFRAKIPDQKIIEIVRMFLSYLGIDNSQSFIQIEMCEIYKLWKKKGVNGNMVLYLEEVCEKNSICT